MIFRNKSRLSILSVFKKLTLLSCCLFSALTLIPYASASNAKPQPNQGWQAMTASTGLWHGKLYFKKDPNSPAEIRIKSDLTPDGATIISYLTYSKNNKKEYAMELMTYNEKTNQLYESYYQNGNAVNHVYPVDDGSFQNANHWKVIYSRKANQHNKNATIKLEWQREGNKIIRKELICSEANNCQLNRETRLVLQS